MRFKFRQTLIRFISFQLPVALSLLISVAASSLAEDRVAHSVAFNLDSLYVLRQMPHLPARGKQGISAIRFHIDIPGLGQSEFRFVSKVVPSWKALITDESGRHEDKIPENTLLLQGAVSVPGHRLKPLPAAGAFVGDKFRAAFYAPSDRRLYTIRLSGHGGDSKPAEIDRVFIAQRTLLCAVKDSPAISSLIGKSVSRAETVRVIELATDADPAWFNVYGSESNAEIAAIVNEAATIYESQLGLTFEITQQNVFSSGASSPYTETDSEALLEQFRSYGNSQGHLGSADLYHFFTGIDLGGGSDPTIGIAYVAVACVDPEFSYGLSENSPGLHSVVFAHEIAHNLSATHDSSLPISIMFPALPETPPTDFSDLSKAEISSFVSENGSCLSEGELTPTPTPTSGPAQTPTAGPSPTPTTPGGGGGGGGGGDDGTGPTPTEVTLSASFSGTAFAANINLSAADQDCTLMLRGSPLKTKVNSGKIIFQSVADATSYSLAAEVTAKINRQFSRRIHLAAHLSCPTGSWTSYIKTIQAPRSASGSISPQKWLAALKRALSEGS